MKHLSYVHAFSAVALCTLKSKGDVFTTAVTVYLGALFLALGALQASMVLHHRLLSNCLRSPMSFYDTTPLGRIVNRFSKDVDVVDTLIPRNVDAWLKCTLHVLATMIVISVSTPYFLTVIIPLGFIYYIVQVLSQLVQPGIEIYKTLHVQLPIVMKQDCKMLTLNCEIMKF